MKLLPFEYATRNLGRSPMRLAPTVFGSGLVVLLIMIAGSFMVGMQATLAVCGAEQIIMLLGVGRVESVDRSEVGMDSCRVYTSGAADEHRGAVQGCSRGDANCEEVSRRLISENPKQRYGNNHV